MPENIHAFNYYNALKLRPKNCVLWNLWLVDV